MTDQRMTPFHCPYCGEEDLRPSGSGPGTWDCASCARAFRLSFLGLLAPGRPGGPDVRTTAHRTSTGADHRPIGEGDPGEHR
nr:hypothetical protein [Wenjunlia vitaminophila]